MKNIKLEFLSQGYDFTISDCGMYFSLFRNGKQLLKDQIVIDAELFLEMMANENDFSLELMFFNSDYEPMIETDFYKWLTREGNTNFHSIETIKQYLFDHFLFVYGKNSIRGEVIRTLRYIGQYWFDREIKPTLQGIK